MNKTQLEGYAIVAAGLIVIVALNIGTQILGYTVARAFGSLAHEKLYK